MSIHKNDQARKSFRMVLETPQILTMVIIICVGVSSFALGRLSAQRAQTEPVMLQRYTEPAERRGGGRVQVVASRYGEKYHYPWCSGADRINDENLLTFSSIERAQQAGYQPAQNCPGL